MAHSHSHAGGEGQGNYFLDQIFTVLTCGALGVTAIVMVRNRFFERTNLLDPWFFTPVMLGGMAIVLLVVIRAIAVWKLSKVTASNPDGTEGNANDCGFDHPQGFACGFDHGGGASHSHGGDDDHDHEHGWAPWRYIVLIVPVLLFLLNLPREGLSETRLKNEGAGASLANPRRPLSLAAGGVVVLPKSILTGKQEEVVVGFRELAEAAAKRMSRENLEGKYATVRGQFYRLGDKEFTLYRVNMTCCAADAVPLKVRIETPDVIQNLKHGTWISVKGEVSFALTAKGDEYVPIITLASNNDIQPTEKARDVDEP